MTALTDEEHRPKRKVVSQAFTPANVNSFESEIGSNAVDLVARVRREGQDGTRAVNWLMLGRYFALDTLGLVAFGEQLGIVHGDGGQCAHARCGRPDRRSFISDAIDGVPIAQAPRIILPKPIAKLLVSLPIPAIRHAVQSENKIIEVRELFAGSARALLRPRRRAL